MGEANRLWIYIRIVMFFALFSAFVVLISTFSHIIFSVVIIISVSNIFPLFSPSIRPFFSIAFCLIYFERRSVKVICTVLGFSFSCFMEKVLLEVH